MKCHGCSSLMVLDKQETGTGSCVQWHSCPLCGKVRLTSQPETNLDDVALGSVDLDNVDLDNVNQPDAYSQDSLDTQQRVDLASINHNYT